MQNSVCCTGDDKSTDGCKVLYAVSFQAQLECRLQHSDNLKRLISDGPAPSTAGLHSMLHTMAFRVPCKPLLLLVDRNKV